jgi:hypothetical protein
VLILAVDGALDIGRWVTTAGGLGVASVVGWMLLTGRLILPREYNKLEAERNEWKARAEKNEHIAWKATETMERLLPMVEWSATQLRDMPPPPPKRAGGPKPPPT